MVVAAVLSAVGVVLSAGLGPEGEMAVVHGLRATVLRPFIATHEVFEQRVGLAARVERLERRADSLAMRALETADLADENRQLRLLLDLPAREVGDFFVAELVPGHTPAGEPSGFQLRTRAGLPFEPPLSVATPEGLLGVVRTARGRVGMGEYWTHPDFRVDVTSLDGEANGIVRAFVDANGDQLMLLQGVPFQTDVPVDTELVTSGVGGIYPRGLAVGRVLAEHEQQLGWTHSFLVEPAVRPGRQDLVIAWRPGVLADSAYVVPAESPGAADPTDGPGTNGPSEAGPP
ncbi:MAG: rod shape-determining protein MreC [Gemmatimonadota bacterium]